MAQQSATGRIAKDPASGRDAGDGRQSRTPSRVRPGRSTGPRTPKGKARSAQNAFRHGLSIPIRADPVWRTAVLRLERELAGSESGLHQRYFAAMAAEGTVELLRIARSLDALLGDGLEALRKAGETGAGDPFAALRKLERYERRAYAKQLRALEVLRPTARSEVATALTGDISQMESGKTNLRLGGRAGVRRAQAAHSQVAAVRLRTHQGWNLAERTCVAPLSHRATRKP